jgi:hypothetical protein
VKYLSLLTRQDATFEETQPVKKRDVKREGDQTRISKRECASKEKTTGKGRHTEEGERGRVLRIAPPRGEWKPGTLGFGLTKN